MWLKRLALYIHRLSHVTDQIMALALPKKCLLTHPTSHNDGAASCCSTCRHALQQCRGWHNTQAVLTLGRCIVGMRLAIMSIPATRS